jgi:hypothetical protein
MLNFAKSAGSPIMPGQLKDLRGMNGTSGNNNGFLAHANRHLGSPVTALLFSVDTQK